MHITADALIDALSEKGYRITKARRAVCEVVAAAHDEHLSAADMYDRAREKSGTRLDRSTVYRTLEALEESGLLAHSHLGHGPSVYHLAEDAGHQHLICRQCGRTSTLPEEETRRLVDAITVATGFVADVNHFALSGLCPICADGSST
ncbi:MAG TPA: Fur family transcriptional regulator [Acidimicrobiia bacterium]|nr:Fur family transcriptional regulator [Acidimicrobiia bacterium]